MGVSFRFAPSILFRMSIYCVWPAQAKYVGFCYKPKPWITLKKLSLPVVSYNPPTRMKCHFPVRLPTYLDRALSFIPRVGVCFLEWATDWLMNIQFSRPSGLFTIYSSSRKEFISEWSLSGRCHNLNSHTSFLPVETGYYFLWMTFWR